MKTDLITRLNRLGADVMSRYPFINNGGCCVFAAIIMEALEKHDIPVKGIVSTYFPKTSIDSARMSIKHNTIDEWGNNGIQLSHVGVEFKFAGKTWHYDSNGVHRIDKKLDGMIIYKGRLLYDEVRALAGKKDGWNTMFNRRHTPAIRKLVAAHLC